METILLANSGGSAGREDYRKIWRAIRPQFHDDFVAYMDRMVSQQSRVVRT